MILNYKIARLPNYKIRVYRPLACQIEPGD